MTRGNQQMDLDGPLVLPAVELVEQMLLAEGPIGDDQDPVHVAPPRERAPSVRTPAAEVTTTDQPIGPGLQRRRRRETFSGTTKT